MTLGAGLLRGLLVAILFTAVAPLFTRTVRREKLWLAALPAAVLYYGAWFGAFMIVSTVAYLVSRGLATIVDRDRRWRWTIVALGVLFALFIAGRTLQLDQRPLFAVRAFPLFAFTLDMWLVLRLVTLFWETGSGRVRLASYGAYLGWVALPVTLAGPLVRFSELPEVMTTRRELLTAGGWWTEVAVASAKLAVGILLGAWPAVMQQYWPEARPVRGAVMVFISGPLGFYLTFAGFYQLMQALGRPVGLSIPDSFNWPFGRENISAFWANWNMTATRVFRDYLFYNRWGFHGYNVYVNTILLFALVGLWHAVNPYWILWGLLHGVMFCCFLAWRRHQGRAGWLPLRGTAVARMASRTATYLGVCACWYLPSKILQRLGG